jgi:sRNA-binding protein
MSDVIALVGGLPPAITAGWMIWMAWMAVQVMWYRRARVATTKAARPAAVAPAVARRDAAPRPTREAAPRPAREEAPRPAREDASALPAPLPAIDLSDIRAAAERPSKAGDSAPQPAGSILGLDPRPSAN